jgi:magnesium-transporting ATPase (P-type)
MGGYKFIARNLSNIGIEIKHNKSKEVYEILHEFPFDSNRKRMSLILKKKGSDEILMLTKGADSIMIPRLLIDSAVQKKIEEDLTYFAL